MKRSKVSASKADTEFIIRDPDHEYSESEICDLLERAQSMGFSLEKGSELEELTVRELEVLVNRKQ